MKLVWCPDTASKAYIDGVRAVADDGRGRRARARAAAADGSPELAELLAAMAGGWNAQLIVDAPDDSSSSSSSPSSPSSPRRRPPASSATSLALAAAARRTGGRYARLDADADDDGGDSPPPPKDSVSASESSSSSGAAAEAAMARRLEGVDLLVLDARRRDAAAVLRAARPGPRGMVVVVRHGDATGGVRRRSAAAPWGAMMAAGTRVVRAAYLPIGAGGVEVLHVGVGKGPSMSSTQQQHGSRSTAGGRGGGRWIRHVDHRTGEEHVFRRQ